MKSKDLALIIRGARQHNLKNIDLDLPHGRFIAITGPSGSGKSSLAFDTIFAEGQRRFLDSLSTYARQFLEKIARPDVDRMENVQPTIAIEQKNRVKSSRSTIGTATEIYDYIRLLYSKVGKIICPDCDIEVRPDTVQNVVETIVERFSGKHVYITFPHIVPPNPKEFISRLGKLGLNRAHINGEVVDLVNAPPKKLPKTVELILDRLVPDSSNRVRISEGIENCYRYGDGTAHVFVEGKSKPTRFTRYHCCSGCGKTFLEPSPLFFSFNSPYGACAGCKGFGNILKVDERLVVPNPDLSLSEGAIEPFTKPSRRRWEKRILDMAKNNKISVSTPYNKLTQNQVSIIWNGVGKERGINQYFAKMERKKYKMSVKVFLSRYKSAFTCKMCHGNRLRGETAYVKIDGVDISVLVQKNVDRLLLFFEKIELDQQDAAVAKDIIKDICSRLTFMRDVGLGYLTLHRETKTLSGGEAQRIMLATQLGSRLFRTTYVLDEPSIGLHPRDNFRLIGILNRLKALSNTVIVVEHDPVFINAADYLVEMGPASGERGGEVVFSGTKEKFSSADSLTAKYLRGDLSVQYSSKHRPITKGKPTKFLSIEGASANNLKNLTVNIPLERLVAITGVSGSGKSSLMTETIYPALAKLFNGAAQPFGPFSQLTGFRHISGVALLDQQPIGKTPRSNPITYIKGFDEIRHLFADLPESRSRGYTPGAFSFNVDGGRCPACNGEGYIKVEMHFMADIFLLCDECEGRRYKKEVLNITYKDKSIADVLNMTFSEARSFFQYLQHSRDLFQLMVDVGLGYLKLGQPANTLSGGEAQRLKIARELSQRDKKRRLYLLDEPTTGLHSHDVGLLLQTLDDLVDRGNSVIVIEHNLDLIRAADWIIDLGPDGGDAGGELVAEGTPEQVSKCKKSYTAAYLAPLLS